MKPITRLQNVERIIAKAACVPSDMFYKEIRKKEIVTARHAIWFIAHDFLGYSYPLLGKMYGKDHSTVLHGCRKIRENARSAAIVIDTINAADKTILSEPGSGEPRDIKDWI